MIKNPLPADLAATVEQRAAKPKRVQRPNRVRRQVHPGSRMRPSSSSLDDIALDSVRMERPRGREACDPATDDEDTPSRAHRDPLASSCSSATKVRSNARRIPRASRMRSDNPAIPPRGSYSTTSR